MDQTLAAADALITQQRSQISDLQAKLTAVTANPPRTFSGMEYRTDFKQPGNAGNTGGPDPSKPHGTYIFDPNGGSVLMSPAVPYDNYYFMLEFGAMNWVKRVTQRVDYRLPTQKDFTNCQSVENECHKSTSGIINNMAKAADFVKDKAWTLFDFDKQVWIPFLEINFKTQWIPGRWMSVIAIYDITPDSTTHTSIQIDDLVVPIGKTLPSSKLAGPDKFNFAFQGDATGVIDPTTKKPKPFTLNYRNMRVDVQ